MNCPKCGAAMREREKEDIVIDVCANCRGVFLDAGELEKLTAVEDRYYRSRGFRDDDDDDDDDDNQRRPGDGPYAPSYSRGDERYREEPRHRDEPRFDQGDPRYGQGQRPRKKGGFLSNMFENFTGGEGADD